MSRKKATQETTKAHPHEGAAEAAPPRHESAKKTRIPDALPEAAQRLIDELSEVQAECEANVLAAEDRAWAEGDIAFRLVHDHDLGTSRIAAEINKRRGGRPGRRLVRPRWIQRILEVHRAFPTSDSRSPAATWSEHALAYDIARLKGGRKGRQLAKAPAEHLAAVSAEARALLLAAAQEVHAGKPLDTWLKERRAAERAKARGPAAGPASRDAAYRRAVAAVEHLILQHPSSDQVEALIGKLRPAGQAAA